MEEEKNIYEKFENKSIQEVKKLINNDIISHEICMNKFNNVFIDLLSLHEKSDESLGLKKLIYLTRFKFKKYLLFQKFHHNDIGSKLALIRDLNSFIFFGRNLIKKVKLPNEDIAEIKATNNCVIIKYPWFTGMYYILLIDFSNTKGIISIYENLSLYLMCNDNITLCDNNSLQYEENILCKNTNKLLDLYIKKIIDSFVYQIDENEFIFY